MRFRDLEFFYECYTYRRLSEHSYEYWLYIAAKEEGLDLKLVIRSISPAEHAVLLERELPSPLLHPRILVAIDKL